MQVFYAPEITLTKCLPREESYHAIRVLRLRKNDLIYVVDGNGGFYEARIISEDLSSTLLTIEKNEQNYGARNYHLSFYIAPTKNIDRFEYFLEKAVEIGVDEITPIVCERSERFKLKTERLERIIISAMKQSYKAFKPKLNPVTKFDSVLMQADGINGIAHCTEAPRIHIQKFMEQVKESVVRNIHIYIGPEGDFTPEEISVAQKKGFIGISLGSSRLRTETAGIAACYAINYEFSITS